MDCVDADPRAARVRRRRGRRAGQPRGAACYIDASCGMGTGADRQIAVWERTQRPQGGGRPHRRGDARRIERLSCATHGSRSRLRGEWNGSELSSPTTRTWPPGAYNAIHTCLRLKPEERVTLITDLEALRDRRRPGARDRARRLALQRVRARGVRPAAAAHGMPQGGAGRPGAVAGQRSSPPRRRPGRARLAHRHDRAWSTASGIRHGHMVNIDRQIMLEGMRADFAEVDA